jgi:hypothetical protein
VRKGSIAADIDCLLARGLPDRRGEGILAVEDLDSLFRSRSWLVSLRELKPPSLGKRIPGKPSPDSPRTIGVAVGSIDTAERTGNTRSIVPGLRAEKGPSDFCDKVGEAGGASLGSLLPVNMETGECCGMRGRRPGGGTRWGC